MKPIKDITRGGQIGYHFLNMFYQVNAKFRYFALLLILLIGAFCVLSMPKAYYLGAFNYYNANLVRMVVSSRKKLPQVTYVNEYGEKEKRFAEDVVGDWLVVHNKNQFLNYLKITGYICFGGVICVYLIVMGTFMYLGKYQRTSKFKRGAKFLDEKYLIKKLNKEKIASNYKIGKLPLVKKTEVLHIVITGTTGSGKSNCIKSLVMQLRKQNEKVIIIDTSGEYVDSFFEADKDLILNPYDKRAVTWNMWKECSNDFELDNFADALFPSNISHDDFWSKAAKLLFKGAFEAVSRKKKPSYKELYTMLTVDSMSQLQAALRNTSAASLIDGDGKGDNRTAFSIRSTAIPYVEFFKALPEVKKNKNSFTIKEWFRSGSGILFISCSATQRKTMKSLFTAWTDIAITSLMSSGIKLIGDDHKTWFIIDELTSLARLPSLQTILAESRKYGGCCVVGTQSVPDIYKIYGHNPAQSLLNNFNTKIFFRCIDPSTQQWIVNALGRYEENKTVENYSYGANTMGDRANITTQTREQNIILGSELAQLDDLEAFVQLPKGLPITKIKMQIIDLPKKN